MNNTKHLTNMVVENSRITSVSSPLRRRSSIAVKSLPVELTDNDDEAERATLRRETSESISSTSNRRSLALGSVIGSMSSPQIAEGIAECIKLNTQNKINAKNAFSLNMIDFMSYLVRNRHESISNLHMAGTSLDVSAKIYAFRVDALHQDILKMAGNLHHKDKKENENEETTDDSAVPPNEDMLESDEQVEKKKKKKRSSSKVLTTIEALQGEAETVSLNPVMFGEADCQTTDTLYQAMLPQHCGMGLGLHPYKDVILDQIPDDAEENLENEPRIKWPPIEIDFSRDIITYPNFEFLNWSNDQESDDMKSPEESPSLILDDLAFDLDASIPPDEGPENFGQNFYDMDDDHEENGEAFYAEGRSAEAVASLPNILAKMSSKKSDYSFFGENVSIRWMGPGNWKIKSVPKHLSSSKVIETCKQTVGKKRKEMELTFDPDDNCDESFIILKKNTAKLQAKTIRVAWSEKKLDLPRENHELAWKKMCQFYLRPDDIISFMKNIDANATTLSDEPHQYNYGNENDTINYCPNSDNDDDVRADDALEDSASRLAAPPDGFMGDNLIEAPKLTQKILIPYSQRARKLDMRRLKKCIWSSLTCKDQNDMDKENVNTEEQSRNNVSVIKENTKFLNIFIDLPKKLPTHEAKELSFATAFVSLLHLANEKCLKLLPEENFSDITIFQDII